MRPRIERVERIAAPGDGMIERLAGLLELALIFVKLAQLFAIGWRRIVDNSGLNLLDARTPPESLKHATKESQVRQHFREDVHGGARRSEKKNDVKPIVLRPPPDEVHNRQALHEKAPGIEKMAQTKHGRPPCQQNRFTLSVGQTETPLSACASYCPKLLPDGTVFPCYDGANESHRNARPRPGRWIFFRPQSLRHCRDPRAASALRRDPSPTRIAGSCPSVGSGNRHGALSSG